MYLLDGHFTPWHSDSLPPTLNVVATRDIAALRKRYDSPGGAPAVAPVRVDVHTGRSAGLLLKGRGPWLGCPASRFRHLDDGVLDDVVRRRGRTGGLSVSGPTSQYHVMPMAAASLRSRPGHPRGRPHP